MVAEDFFAGSPGPAVARWRRTELELLTFDSLRAVQ